MKLYKVTAKQPGSPFQVEFPLTKKVKGEKKPVNLERTKEGSLHFRPGSISLLSGDEYEYLQGSKIFGLMFVFQGEEKGPQKRTKEVSFPQPIHSIVSKKKKKS